MYRFFADLIEPPDGPDDRELPAGTVMTKLLWRRLRITTDEVRPAAVEAGAFGEDHIGAVCRALDVLPSALAAHK